MKPLHHRYFLWLLVCSSLVLVALIGPAVRAGDGISRRIWRITK
jgi:hypothetical protein